MSYDPACEELAHHFLSDLARPDLAAELAQHIQDEIESWLDALQWTIEHPNPPPPPPAQGSGT